MAFVLETYSVSNMLQRIAGLAQQDFGFLDPYFEMIFMKGMPSLFPDACPQFFNIQIGLY
jgi:hypothetical protein